MKKIATTFSKGILALILPLVVILVVLWIKNFLNAVSISFVENEAANFFLNLGTWLLLIYLLGWLREKEWFRNVALAILTPIPVISVFANFIFGKTPQDNYPEVFVPFHDAYFLGVIVNEFELSTDTLGRSRQMCLVLLLSAPIPASGNFIIKERHLLIPTGRTAKATGITAASLGLHFELPDKQNQNPPANA